MKRLWIAFFCLCLLLSGCKQTEQTDAIDSSAIAELNESFTFEPILEEGFSFDPEQYERIDEAIIDRFLPESVDEVENLTRKDEYGVILLCEVAGDSVNRIMKVPMAEREPGKIYGVNHVITPIIIKNLIYTGASVSLEEGDTIYLYEKFQYVTKATKHSEKIEGIEVPDTSPKKNPEGSSESEEKKYTTKEYDPLEKGKTYLLYASHEPPLTDAYKYKGQPPLLLSGLRDAVYCLSDDTPQQYGKKTPNYETWWWIVKERYGDLVENS